MRTDTHRPSQINPEEYEFVALGCQKYAVAEATIAELKIFNDHRAMTGGMFSSHEHGGSCHICGANAVYTAYFYHRPTNTYISTGMECAQKMEMGDGQRFKRFRNDISAQMKFKAGKQKAQAMLDDCGLLDAWGIYNAQTDKTDKNFLWKWNTVKSVVDTIIKNGSISERQEGFLRKLVDEINSWDKVQAERQAKRDAERAIAEDCPNGRIFVIGEVVSVKCIDTDYGVRQVMTVKSDRGFLVWGSVPSNIDDLSKGDRVSFTATVTRSDKDSKFGFFKRPSKSTNYASPVRQGDMSTTETQW